MANPLVTQEQDEAYMGRALVLAEQAYGCSAPNPLVGALVVHGATTLGEGVHRGAGAPHAEVLALGNARTGASIGTAGERRMGLGNIGHAPPAQPSKLRCETGASAAWHRS